ncbi:RDD family protein [Sandaracinus amylolyticus]|uniref:RDD family protein n=1 Tax=Sandaracinus amylolyticus TaxID=927083 RepID=UPI001F40E362|nr:RDD family protein [Sandaracinus amylolyticus]UJR85018.1 Hypothetical protein I5071_70970 [Sandaracinus amylolyticus]
MAADSLVPAELPVRLAARAIDVAIVVAMNVGLGQLMGFGFDWLIAGALLVLAYFALLDALVGATLGKLALGLRVVGPEGERVTMKQALTREAFTVLGAIPFLGPILALAAWIAIVVTIRKSPLRQGRHDVLAGGTRVVRAAALRNP